MGKQSALLVSIDQLIMLVGGIASVNAHGLGEEELVDHVVVSLHDHLGKLKQFASAHRSSFNASEQYLVLSSAAKELDGVRNNLLVLRQEGIVTHREFDIIERTLAEISNLIQQEIDPEYT